MTPSPASAGPAASLPGHVKVLVVGAGFGGIAAAVRLTQAGHEVLVVERADDVGGTWRDNTYPGAGCDVESRLYSLSFAPNPDWSRRFSLQPEILAYLQGVVRRFGIAPLIRCGVELREADWDDAAQLWRVTTSAGTLTCDVLISAAGGLSAPSVPTFPGQDGFVGTVMHSARWDHTVDLAGKDVAVVGTGASAIQIVPSIARTARSVTVFQRTPSWVLPRLQRRIGPLARVLYRRFPALERAARLAVYLSRESHVVGFVARPGLLRVVEAGSRRALEREIKDPHLRTVLTPDFRAGCKRILISDHWYRALARPNVEVVPSALAALDGEHVEAADGTRRRSDVVVLATGFEATRIPIAAHLRGRDGRTLAQVWERDGMQALRGTTVAGFPNLFVIVGPNTGLGHSSMVHVIESQVAYVVDALRAMREHGIGALDPTPRAQDAWNADLQRRMTRTIWTTGGCASWYQDARGVVTTLWPGSTVRLRRELRRIDLAEYTRSPRRAATPATATPGAATPGAATPATATSAPATSAAATPATATPTAVVPGPRR